MGRKLHSQPIKSEFIALEYGSQIIWSDFFSDGQGTKVLVRCGMCGKERHVYRQTIRAAIRRKRPFTGLCNRCGKHPPINNKHGSDHSAFKGGRYMHNEGYVLLLVNALPIEVQAIAKPMSRSGGLKGSKRVLEHRLVMALYLGRPLTKDEVVHHRNGVRSENEITNLKLFTVRKEHGRGHGDFYQQFQEALSTISRLEKQIRELTTSGL